MPHHPDFIASGLFFLAFIGLVFAGHNPIAWEQQKEREYRRKERRKTKREANLMDALFLEQISTVSCLPVHRPGNATCDTSQSSSRPGGRTCKRAGVRAGAWSAGIERSSRCTVLTQAHRAVDGG